MRINNKYIRNRHFQRKHWNTIRRKSHPFETSMPWYGYRIKWDSSTEGQIRRHFEWITEQARALDRGSHRQPFMTAPKWFRKQIASQRKAKERMIMAKIRQGNYEEELPKWRSDAAWLYW